MSVNEPFTIHCRILPSEPYVNLRTGKQTEQLITASDAKIAAIEKRNRDAWFGLIMPAHLFAPEHHDRLIKNSEEGHKKNRQWKTASDFVFIDNAVHQSGCSAIMTTALEAACTAKGVTEKYEDKRFRRIAKRQWLLDHLPEYRDDQQSYYELVCRTCLACEHKEAFLAELQIEMENNCRNRTVTALHRSTRHKTDPSQDVLDPVHEQRIDALRASLSIDPASGTIICNQTAYAAVMDELAQESIDYFDKRLSDLRQKMQRNAQELYRATSDDPKYIRKLRHALDIKSYDPFLPPLEQNEAEQIFRNCLKEIPPIPIVHKALQIALDDKRLIIALSNCDRHIENVAGKSLDERHDSITLGQSGEKILHLSRTPDLHTVVEELAHHAIRRIYGNGANPFLSHGDQRKSLITSAIREDIERNSMQQFREDFGFIAGGYTTDSLYPEVPAKALAMMATGEWDKIRDRYPVIDSYMTHTLLRDMETFEQQGKLEAYGTHTASTAHRAMKASIKNTHVSEASWSSKP